LSSQVKSLLDLALGAGGRLVKACIGLAGPLADPVAVPGWLASTHLERSAHTRATARERHGAAGLACWSGTIAARVSEGGSMRRLLLALVAALVAMVMVASPAGAITYGELDAGEHPYVGS
jgi:hypothetical protein